MPTYNEHKTNQQSNINWGETFKMGVKAPVVADRIFDTYADADAYIKDVNSSAIAGLIVSVINDGVNNGIYYINSDIHGTVDWCGNPVLYLYKQEATQSDWDVDNPSDMSYIKNKPTGDFGTYSVI